MTLRVVDPGVKQWKSHRVVEPPNDVVSRRFVGEPIECDAEPISLDVSDWLSIGTVSAIALADDDVRFPNDSVDPEGDFAEIEHLEEGYEVRRPIPVEIRQIGPGNFEASFEDAGISISGTGPQDAFQALAAEILDTLDTLLSERNLSAPATKQLRVLRSYIGRSKPASYARR